MCIRDSDYVMPDGGRSKLCLVAGDDLGIEMFIECQIRDGVWDENGVPIECPDPPIPPPEPPPEEDSDEDDDPTPPTCCNDEISCTEGYFCDPYYCVCIELDPIIDDPDCCDADVECPDDFEGFPGLCIQNYSLNEDGTTMVTCNCEFANCCNGGITCMSDSPSQFDELTWGCNHDTCICETVPNPDFDPCNRPYLPGQMPPDYEPRPVDENKPPCDLPGYDVPNDSVVPVPDDGYWVWNPWTCEWDEWLEECDGDGRVVIPPGVFWKTFPLVREHLESIKARLKRIANRTKIYWSPENSVLKVLLTWFKNDTVGFKLPADQRRNGCQCQDDPDCCPVGEMCGDGWWYCCSNGNCVCLDEVSVDLPEEIKERLYCGATEKLSLIHI
mgnify:CR=1 FL=1